MIVEIEDFTIYFKTRNLSISYRSGHYFWGWGLLNGMGGGKEVAKKVWSLFVQGSQKRFG